jgi:four helix bundle protein
MAKAFDLEKRTTEFAKAVIKACRTLPRSPINDRIIGQVVGASGSVGANYREANDALGKNDFLQRMRIARREAKESHHWLELLLTANPSVEDRVKLLINEADELKRILSSIIEKSR